MDPGHRDSIANLVAKDAHPGLELRETPPGVALGFDALIGKTAEAQVFVDHVANDALAQIPGNPHLPPGVGQRHAKSQELARIGARGKHLVAVGDIRACLNHRRGKEAVVDPGPAKMFGQVGNFGQQTLVGALGPNGRLLIPQLRGSLGAFALFKIFFVAGPKESAKTGVAHGDVVALGIVFDEELPVEIAVQGTSRSQWLHF